MRKSGMSLLPASVFLLFFSCVQLKEVAQFSATCQTSLDKAASGEYGYYNYCKDSCIIFNSTGKFLADFTCSCKDHLSLDTILVIEFNTLSAYYAALAKLAGSGTAVNFSPIGSAVPAGTYGTISVTQDESTAVGALATAIGVLVTTKFKSTKVKEIILQKNDSVLTLLQNLRMHLDDLKSKIKNMQDKYLKRVNDMLGDTTHADVRWLLISDCKERYEQLDLIIARYDNRMAVLGKIITGQKELFDHVDDLKSESLKKSILGLAGNLIYLSNAKN
jgi:hypothetical protein